MAQHSVVKYLWMVLSALITHRHVPVHERVKLNAVGGTRVNQWLIVAPQMHETVAE